MITTLALMAVLTVKPNKPWIQETQSKGWSRITAVCVAKAAELYLDKYNCKKLKTLNESISVCPKTETTEKEWNHLATQCAELGETH